MLRYIKLLRRTDPRKYSAAAEWGWFYKYSFGKKVHFILKYYYLDKVSNFKSSSVNI